jgi:hypothetical protein
VKDEINEAFNKGNSKQLSTFLNDMIDMSMENMEATYSRYQAESILNEFFEKNPPASFHVEKEGYLLSFKFCNSNIHNNTRVLI